MKWLLDLFNDHSTIVYVILVYSLVIAAGVLLGKLAVKGVSFGIAGVLFTGILVSYLGFSVEKEILEFIREFGLILFVYTMGLQVGPGFFASMQSQGLKLNAIAVLTVLCGAAVVVVLFYAMHIPMPVLVGLMSGAVTNTPGLGAAQQTLRDLAVTNPELANLPPIGTYYALAYPGGVLGIILVMIITKLVNRVNVEQENQLLAKKNTKRQPRPATITLQVKNPSIIGRPVQTLFDTLQSNFVVTRVGHDNDVSFATKETVLHKDDVILVVANPRDFHRLRTLVGTESNVDLVKDGASSLVSLPVRITHKEVCSRPLAELDTINNYGVTVTRVTRAGIEFIPSGNTRLQFGDVVRVVGEEKNVESLTKDFGNSDRKLKEPHIAGLFVGIALGVIVGSIPFFIPGVSTPVKLGLAGGPLIVAILISRYGSLFPLTSYVSQSANYMVREIGIVLFLASVGLKAGPDFVRTLVSSEGPVFLLIGFAITVVPLIIAATVARLFYKLNFLELFGLMAGSCTDPPALAFSTQMAGSDAPAVAYASVYPLTMFLRILIPQLLILLFV
ncbi:MAG TPA: putative transporter [Chitinophagaceae bacterium]